ncbi:MAG: hypothetical protein BWX64_02795 [Acidobacteria bacterium ADurb.Bin051]|nr:MAG: hypothetical protein BWX64_02795 [Acidobacteria bacterium ADurb.Bin051]
MQERRVGDVLLRLRVEPQEPVEARIGAAGFGHRAREHHAEEGPQHPRGDRIADQEPPPEAGIEQLFPVGRRLVGGEQALVVDEHRQRPVDAVVALPGAAGGVREGAGPARLAGGEQAVGGAAGEDRVRPAEPDVGLRVGTLRTEPVVDLLRAHVEPTDVDLRVRRLVGLFEEHEQIAPVRRIDDHRRAPVAATAGGEGEHDEKKTGGEESVAHRIPWEPADLMRPAAARPLRTARAGRGSRSGGNRRRGCRGSSPRAGRGSPPDGHRVRGCRASPARP